MVTIYAWLEIRATYLDEDLHPEIDEKKVFDDIDNLIKKLKYNELKVIEKNYSRFVQFSVMENHKTERTVLPVDEPTVYVTLCVYPSNAALVSVTVYFPYGALLIT